MEIPDNLELKDSPVHGKGMFAIKKISAGDVIGEFTGIKMTKTEFKATYGLDRSYTYWTQHYFPNSTVIVAKDPRNFITYINERSVPNVKLYKKILVAVSDIEVGEELFLHYTKDMKRNYALS